MIGRTPFEEGWDAGLRGYTDPSVICPYEEMTKEYRQWISFYRMALMYSGQEPKLEPAPWWERIPLVGSFFR